VVAEVQRIFEVYFGLFDRLLARRGFKSGLKRLINNYKTVRDLRVLHTKLTHSALEFHPALHFGFLKG
jgi:hypothetical protein